MEKMFNDIKYKRYTLRVVDKHPWLLNEQGKENTSPTERQQQDQQTKQKEQQQEQQQHQHEEPRFPLKRKNKEPTSFVNKKNKM